MQLWLGELTNDPSIAFVLCAPNATIVNLIPQDSNL